MSVREIQQKMETLKMQHTSDLIPELLTEATKQKSPAIDFFEKVLTLEVQAKEERRKHYYHIQPFRLGLGSYLLPG